MPVSLHILSISGCGLTRSFKSSVRIRSALIFSSVCDSSQIARRVASSISYPNWAEKRTARIILSASSVKRSFASPTHRITFFEISSIPPKISTKPASSLYAMALIVKSRLLRSSCNDAVNVTSFGCLESSYSPSIR